MDGPIITRSAIISGKVDLCRALLGKVLDKFEDGQISINWLEKNFDELPQDRTEEFRWRQSYPLPPRDLKQLHKVDIQGKNDNYWAERHREHIEAW
ncbi:hypothetical protein J1N35_038376 [Gossypium stocksii]|uniref:Uncharacterized protein n=1 Tax=Gossypium stocksii TaxID=47602 RepID=A0A9D3ULQ9_9ROSI|nr:hypothetical protein J1N35_038376 [Gossypium stocksii]